MGKDCRQTLFSAQYVSEGKECRQTLLSAQYVQSGFTSSAVVYVVPCRCLLTVLGVSDVMGQPKKLIKMRSSGGWSDIWVCKDLFSSGIHS